MTSSAAAQDVLLVAAGPDEPPEALGQTAIALEEALPAAERPLQRAPNDLVGDTPAAFSAELRARLDAGAEQIVEDVAFGRTAAVLTGVAPLVAEATRDLDALGTDPSASRRVVDLLLFEARAHQRDEHVEEAQESVRRALMVVPDAEPDTNLHPPEVLTLFRTVEAERRATGAQLAIEVEGATAECELRLNGQLLGAPPWRVRLFAGRYAIRASCGLGPGRVHHVVLGSADETARIAPRLDAVLDPSDTMHTWLRYPIDPTVATVREDAAALAAQFAPATVLLLRVDGDELVLERFEASRAEPVARASVSSSDDALAAARALAEGIGGARPDPGPLAPRSAERADDGLAIAAWVLWGAAIATAGAGWGVTIEYLDRAAWARAAEFNDPDFQDRQDRRDELEAIPWVLGAVSSALALAGMPLGLPSNPEPSAGAWVVGAIGLAAVAGGIVALAQHRTCATDNDPCDRFYLYEPLGGLLVLNGATLVMVPLMSYLRAALGLPDIAPFATLRPGADPFVPGGAVIGLAGMM